MIEITLWQNQKQQIKEFLIEGHAGYGEEGWDIVCAGVSALTIATINGLTEYVSLPMDVEVEDGYIHCILKDPVTEVQILQGEAILQTMVLALENMKNEYGQYMNINKIYL